MIISASEVKKILEDPFSREWSIQGFGMLRTYLDPDGVHRLHIWDVDSVIGNVSTIHDHPWDFESLIISGELTNQRYQLDAEVGVPFYTSELICGVGGGLIGTPEKVKIGIQEPEVYSPGGRYSQLAPELHESFPKSGAVTIIKRDFHDNRDIARVCWSIGTEWGSAEPRAATIEEVQRFTQLALGKWNG